MGKPIQFQPLELVTNRTVGTAAAAYYLDRKPQTLRDWACKQEGPVTPIRIHGRVSWPAKDLKAVMRVYE